MTSIILLFSFLPCICLLATASTNSVTPTQPLTDGHILYSPNNYFQLKFFNPWDSKNRYVGIWCCTNRPIPNRFVWVANREKPLTDSLGVFAIQNGGDLVVLDGMKKAVWSSNTSYVMNNSSVAELLDSGNLVLREVNSVRVIWQSFDHPSDTLISGMKVGINLRTGETWTLRSWRNDRDPAPGSFTFGIDPQSLKQFFIWRRSIPYWRGIFWNGTAFRSPLFNLITSTSFNYSIISSEDEVYFTILYPTDIDSYSFLVIKPEGIFECFLTFSGGGGGSLTSTYSRKDQCRVSGSGCGTFSSCNENGTPQCKCLPGFEPSSPGNWSSGDWTDGCRRRTPASCRDLSKFILLKRVKLTPPDYAENMFGSWVPNGCYSAYAFKNGSGDGDSGTRSNWSEGNLRGIIENDDEEEGSEWWDLHFGLTSSEFGGKFWQVKIRPLHIDSHRPSISHSFSVNETKKQDLLPNVSRTSLTYKNGCDSFLTSNQSICSLCCVIEMRMPIIKTLPDCVGPSCFVYATHFIQKKTRMSMMNEHPEGLFGCYNFSKM